MEIITTKGRLIDEKIFHMALRMGFTRRLE